MHKDSLEVSNNFTDWGERRHYENAVERRFELGDRSDVQIGAENNRGFSAEVREERRTT